jgi:hypothetical protein
MMHPLVKASLAIAAVLVVLLAVLASLTLPS